MPKVRRNTAVVGKLEVASAYEVLGVGALLGVARIRERYMLLARENHPDKGGDAERMAQITEAWTTLRDPQLRKTHDAVLALRGETPRVCQRCGGTGERTVGLRGGLVSCKVCQGTGR